MAMAMVAASPSSTIAASFEIGRVFGWCEFEDLKIIAERQLAQINGSERYLAVDEVTKIPCLSRGLLDDEDGELERARYLVEAVGRGQVDGYACIEQDRAARHASPCGFG